MRLLEDAARVLTGPEVIAALEDSVKVLFLIISATLLGRK